MLELLIHVLLDEMHGHMTRPLDHHLNVIFPGNLGQFPQSSELGKLRLIVGVGNGAWPQAIAQRERHIVLGTDGADLAEMLIQEIFLVMGQTPFGNDRAAPGDDPGDPLGRHRHIGQQQTGVNGEIIHALFGLFDQGVPHHLPTEVFGDAVDLFQRLIHGDCAYRHRAIAQYPFPGLMDMTPSGQVHHGIRAPASGPDQFLHLLLDGGAHR